MLVHERPTARTTTCTEVVVECSARSNKRQVMDYFNRRCKILLFYVVVRRAKPTNRSIKILFLSQVLQELQTHASAVKGATYQQKQRTYFGIGHHRWGAVLDEEGQKSTVIAVAFDHDAHIHEEGPLRAHNFDHREDVRRERIIQSGQLQLPNEQTYS